MYRNKDNQDGFGAVESLLIALIIGIIGLAGWYVLKSKDDADKNPKASSSTQTAKPASSATSLTLATEPYTDPTYGFQLYYPEGWIKTSVKGAEVVFVNPVADKEADGSTFHANVNVVIEPTTETQENYVAKTKTVLLQALTNYKSISSNVLTTADGSRVDLLEGTFDQGTVHVHNYQGIGVQSGSAAIVTTTSHDSNWQKYEPTFKQIMLK